MSRTYSHSALKRFQRCQLQWKYHYIDRLSPKEQPLYLERGSGLHELLALLYTDPDEFLKAYLEADEKDQQLMDRYVEKWELEDALWKVLSVEEEFHIEIDGHDVVFIPDLIVQIGDDVWVVDHKTTANIPDEWDPYNMTDFQHLLYIAGVRMLYPNVRGFLFNYIRTKAPTIPALIKDGSRIGNVRKLDTDVKTLETYAKAVDMLDHEDVQDKLMTLRLAPDRFFQRHYILANDAAVDQCLADTGTVLTEMAKKEEEGGTFPRHVVGGYAGSTACSNCAYQPLCHGEMMGINTDVILLNYIERPEREKK